jgi:putative endonuclease
LYYVYIIECKDGTLYTGWTLDVKERVAKHNQGKGAKYTRSRSPVVLKYFEDFSTKKEALQREHFIKQLSREAKLKLIASHELDSSIE